MLSLLTIHGTTDTVETVHVDHLTSSQKIMDCILKRDIPDDQVKEIDNALHGLIWGKPYVQITPDTFLKFLVAFFQPDSPPPPEEIPMYISSCKAPLGSSLYRHLATFGPDSPSLWNTAGSKIAVIDRKRAGKDGEKQPEPPAEIIILSKPTLVAMKDWEKVLKDATVSFKFKERAKEHRGHVIKETTIKGKIWSALQAGLLSHDLEEDGPSKKKVRTDGGVTKPEDLLALF